MKRLAYYLSALLLSLVAILPAGAREKENSNALYIFRNDGEFNAFFYADITRIAYSRTDTSGVEQADYVVQEIFALDTVYRIPLSAIDSVAFTTPATQYKADVSRPGQELTDYIVASDSVSWFRLSLSVPQNLLPKKGDKLLIENPAPPYLPDGFSGLVTSVEQGSGGYTVMTDGLALEELFDRLVIKMAASAPSGESASARRTLRSPFNELIDTKYESTDTITLPALSGTLSLTDFQGDVIKAFNDNFTVTLDGNASLNYSFTPTLTEFRNFLYVDVGQGVKIYQEMKMLHNERYTLSLSGTVSANLDIPFTIGKDVVKAAAKEGLKTVTKKLGGYDVDFSFGFFINAKGTVKADIFYEQLGHSMSTSSYSEPFNHFPQDKDFFRKEVYKMTRDTLGCTGWSSGLALSMGLYAKAGTKIPCAKRAFELEVRAEVGVRVEEELPAVASQIGTMSVLETGKVYSELNDLEDNATLTIYAGASLTGKLKFWKEFSWAPNLGFELALSKQGLCSSIPNLTGITWEPDKRAPWRGTAIVPIAERGVLFAKDVGIAFFDISDETQTPTQAVDYWYPARFVGYKGHYSLLRYSEIFEDLEPGKFYKAYPQTRLLLYPMLADKEVQVTLGPPSINIDPKHVEFIEGDDSYGIKKIDVITNIKNTEITAEADWLNSIKPNWYKEQGELTIYAESLPEKENIRKGIVTVVGKDKDGKELLSDTVSVTQLRPVLKATPSPVVFDPTGGTRKVTIETTMANVTARKDLSSTNWDLPYTFDFKDNVITITTGVNTSDYALSGLILLEGTTENGYKMDGHISISQEATPPEWAPAVSFNKSEFNLYPRKYSTKIESLCNFKVTDIDGTETYATNGDDTHKWYSLSPKFYSNPNSEGLYTVLWTLTVEPNEWDIDRDATIEFTYKDAAGTTTAKGTITILQKSVKTLVTLKDSVNIHSSGSKKYMYFKLGLPGSMEAKSLDSWLKISQTGETVFEVSADENLSGQVRYGGVEVSVYDNVNNFLGVVDTFYVSQSLVDLKFMDWIDGIELSVEGMSQEIDHVYKPVWGHYGVSNGHDYDKDYVRDTIDRPFTWNLNMSYEYDDGSEWKIMQQGNDLHIEVIKSSGENEAILISQYPYAYYSQWPHTNERDELAHKVKARLSFDLINLGSSPNDLSKVRLTNMRLTIDCLDKAYNRKDYPHSLGVTSPGMTFDGNGYPTWEEGNTSVWTGKSGTLVDSHTEIDKETHYTEGTDPYTHESITYAYQTDVEKLFDDSYSNLNVNIKISRSSSAVIDKFRKKATMRSARATAPASEPFHFSIGE